MSQPFRGGPHHSKAVVAAVVEISNLWSTWETDGRAPGVAILGLCAASILLGRMGRRKYGSRVADRRDKAPQRAT